MASIPLPALHVQPPEQQNPLDNYAKILSMKSLLNQQQMQGQQLQAAQQENQMRALQLRDQQALRQISSDPSIDWTKPESGDIFMQKAAQAGVSPQTLQTIRNSNVEYMKNFTQLRKDQQDMQIKQLDQAAGDLNSVLGIKDPQQKQAAWEQKIASYQQQGVLKPGQMPQQYPGDDAVKPMLNSLQLMSAQSKQAQEAATTQKDIAQAGEASVNAAKTQTEVDFYKGLGLAPGVPVETLGMADWLKKNPGKAPADFLKAKAAWTPLARFQLENATGGGTGGAGNPGQIAQKFGMTQEAFDQAAEKYFSTGQMPALGRGISGIALNKALMNRAGELHPGASLAGNEAAFKANQDSLKKLQGNFDQVSAFENTAGKNLDVFLNQAKGVIDTGSPWLNTPLRQLSEKMVGSQNMAAFNAARTTALTEIAKVLNSSNASGVLSDSARKEVSDLIGPNATLNQIYQAAAILKQDMHNRHQSYQDQIADIQKRLSSPGAGNGGAAGSAAGSTPGAGAFDWNSMPQHK